MGKISAQFRLFALVLATLFFMLTSAGAVNAASFTVNTTLDTNDVSPGNGVCADAAGNCSLRAAITETNQLSTNSATRTHTITLPAGVYTLTLTGTPNEINNAWGDLNIRNSSNLTIQGDSARTTIIQAGTTKTTNGTDGDGIDRVMRSFGTAVKLTLNHLTIRHGKAPSGSGFDNSAGAILYSRGTSTGGALTLNHCAIVDNYGSGGSGGGIMSTTTTTINNTLIARNIAGGNNQGGGMSFAASGDPVALYLSNSTISGNSASGPGGGLKISGAGAEATITNCTITGNTATTLDGGLQLNPGLPVRMRNTIITGNSAPNSGPDLSFSAVIISGGGNLIGNAASTTGWIASDLLNNTAANLGPLVNNQGPTDTHALLVGSSAIDAGQNCVTDASCSTFNAPVNFSTDQRGLARLVNGIGLSTVDIGAYEFRPPDIEAPLTSVLYGNVQVGNAAAQSITITNAGEANLVYSVALNGMNADDFSLNGFAPAPLVPGQSVNLNLTFAPISAGAKDASLVITSNDPDEASISIALNGQGFVPPPVINVSPTNLAFGNVNVGGSQSQQFTIANVGGSALTFSLNLSDTNFSYALPPSTTLAAGQSTLMTVIFAPASSGPKSATLQISSNDPMNALVNVSLSGNGILLLPTIDVTPNALAFGDVMVGHTSTQQFTISNDGNTNLIFSLALSNPAFSLLPPASMTVAPGESTTIAVRFSPTNSGPVSAVVEVSSNDPTNPVVNVGLSGNGVSQPPSAVTVSGKVTNFRGKGVKGITITIARTTGAYTQQVTTDRAGNYSLINVPTNATYTITPRKNKTPFTPSSQTLNITQATSNVNFVVNRGPDEL
ncbi:MAG: choice-of-anchor D domain-containing protein [Blastocatellia bacterium]|nr:choice-of-anchor D domain-containing protein [Blastocatellia bacterium]